MEELRRGNVIFRKEIDDSISFFENITGKRSTTFFRSIDDAIYFFDEILRQLGGGFTIKYKNYIDMPMIMMYALIFGLMFGQFIAIIIED